MFEGFSDAARHVVVIAQREAHARGHETACNAHLMLGVSLANTPISEVLGALGASPDRIRLSVAAHGPEEPTDGCGPISVQARETLRQSRIGAAVRRSRRITTGDVLIALLGDRAVVAVMLRTLGLSQDLVRYTVEPRLRVHES